LFLLQSGRVRLLKLVGATEIGVRVAGPGDVFGEVALLSDAKYDSTAVAISEGVALRVDRNTFRQVLDSNSNVSLRICQQLVRRLREADEQATVLLHRDPETRVTLSLIQKAKRKHARSQNSEPSVRLDVSPLQLAAHAGTDSGAVKRAIASLSERGYVQVIEESLQIPDVRVLDELFQLLNLRDQIESDPILNAGS